MIELSTGFLNFEQFDTELSAIADDFKAFRIGTVYVTFGLGCQPDKLLQQEDIPVRTRELVRFLADSDSEADGVFEAGESNVHIRGGGIEFLLCHERDIHCCGEDSAALRAVRKRWTRDYEFSYERRGGGEWHRLTGRPKDTRER